MFRQQGIGVQISHKVLTKPGAEGIPAPGFIGTPRSDQSNKGAQYAATCNMLGLSNNP